METKILNSEKKAIKKTKNVAKIENVKNVETTKTTTKKEKDIKNNISNFSKMIGEKEIVLQKSIYNYTREEVEAFKNDAKGLRNKIRNEFRKKIDNIYNIIVNPKKTIQKEDFKTFIDYCEFRYKSFNISKKMYLDLFCASNTKGRSKTKCTNCFR